MFWRQRWLRIKIIGLVSLEPRQWQEGKQRSLSSAFHLQGVLSRPFHFCINIPDTRNMFLAKKIISSCISLHIRKVLLILSPQVIFVGLCIPKLSHRKLYLKIFNVIFNEMESILKAPQKLFWKYSSFLLRLTVIEHSLFRLCDQKFTSMISFN